MSSRTRVSAPAFVLAMAPLVLGAQEAADRERWEAEGHWPGSAAASPKAARAEARRARGFSIDLLLVPDATADRVMAFDPATGNLVDANWVPSDPPNLQTPKAALADQSNANLFVVDQISDAVQRYGGVGGEYLGVYAPAGGPITAILDNATCMAYRPGGNLVVCVTGGANQDSIAEFNIAGVHVGNFIANGAGGLDGPFDILFRASDVLVSSINTDQILRYDLTGAFLGVFTAINNFPEQLAEAGNGNVLVANFGGTEEGIVEYTAAGVFVGRYDPPGLSSYRGVYELPNLNLLVSTGTGVHEITRAGALVETKIATTGAQYIKLVLDLTPVELQGYSVE
jgi:hypothetical protein